MARLPLMRLTSVLISQTLTTDELVVIGRVGDRPGVVRVLHLSSNDEISAFHTSAGDISRSRERHDLRSERQVAIAGSMRPLRYCLLRVQEAAVTMGLWGKSRSRAAS